MSLNSSPHGAGREYSRSKARATFTHEQLRTAMAGIEFRDTDAFIDEIPQAYKPIDRVMADAAELRHGAAHAAPAGQREGRLTTDAPAAHRARPGHLVGVQGGGREPATPDVCSAERRDQRVSLSPSAAPIRRSSRHRDVQLQCR